VKLAIVRSTSQRVSDSFPQFRALVTVRNGAAESGGERAGEARIRSRLSLIVLHVKQDAVIGAPRNGGW